MLEFKLSGATHLGREICAFANSLGGRILIGVDDSGLLHPLKKLNTLRSEVQSIARNLEPSINCCLFQGVTTSRILDQKVYDADFLGNYHSAVNYLLAHLNTAYEIGFERTEKLELPEGALREALLNAMAHRDYRKPGDLQVHIFQDRVEIINPGGLVGGLTLKTLGTCSLPRNPLLFGMMHRMNLVEKVGSGLLRIRQMCEAHPCPPPQIEADQDWYRMIFPRPDTKPARGLVQVPGEVEAHDEAHDKAHDEAHDVLTEVEQRMVQACLAAPQSAMELLGVLGHESRSGNFKKSLAHLLQTGVLVRTLPESPRSKKQKYRLTEKGGKLVSGGRSDE